MYITIIILMVIITTLLILLITRQIKFSNQGNRPVVVQMGYNLQPVDSPLKSLSFEQAITLTPLLDNMQLAAEKNAVSIINSQFGMDILSAGTNSISYIRESGEYVVNFSKKGQKLLNADKYHLMKDGNGRLMPILKKNNKIIEQARLTNNTQRLISTASRLSAVIVSAAHIISGADNAKKLKQISKEIKHLIQVRKNDQLGKLESIFKHAKELLAHERTPETYMSIFNLSKEIHELRSTWRRDVEYKLFNIDNPENRNWFVKFFSRKKTTDKIIYSDISNCEEELMLIEFSMLLHISLFDAIGKSDIFLTVSLPDELNQFRSTRSLLNEKRAYISLQFPELSAESIIQPFDNFLGRCESFLPVRENTNINTMESSAIIGATTVHT
jgi:hypothetical protein